MRSEVLALSLFDRLLRKLALVERGINPRAAQLRHVVARLRDSFVLHDTDQTWLIQSWMWLHGDATRPLDEGCAILCYRDD